MKKKNILIIEDDPLVRENIEILLKEEGYGVLIASDGQEGLVSIEKNLPDLIICDLLMPNVDGFEVLATISKGLVKKNIPLIFLTAKIDKDAVVKAYAMGAADYLYKPFRIDELLNSIDKLLPAGNNN